VSVEGQGSLESKRVASAEASGQDTLSRTGFKNGLEECLGVVT
jgi:hypothetical protein